MQSLSVTLRQASDRIREVDERLDELMEATRTQSDTLGLLQSNLAEVRPEDAATRTIPYATKEMSEGFEGLRSAVDRLSVATTRTETLLEELLDRPRETRDQTTWYMTLLAFGCAALAIALATLSYLK